MNEVQILQKLSTAARREQVPSVDARRSVIVVLNAYEYDLSGSWGWMAAFASASAVLVGILAFQLFEAWTDPLQALFWDFIWIMS